MSLNTIVCAGGVGRRFGGESPKQFLPLRGEPVIAWSLATLAALDYVTGLVIVVPRGYETAIPFEKYLGAIPCTVVTGGATRFESVRLGFLAGDVCQGLVMIHDAARPCVSSEVCNRVWHRAVVTGAAICAMPVADTIKKVDRDLHVLETVDRRSLWAIQTPQVLRADWLATCYEKMSSRTADDFTDEASLLERCGYQVAVVEGERLNMKITSPEDLLLAAAVLSKQ